ncbi:MAG: hypothetical protein HY010_21470 [Acidobacteria bacterium]|nr:hypothetical protein [Acidobacteriota bacterium]
MRRTLAIGILFAVSSAALGQSLGDAARQNRQKEKTSAKAPKKVITNDEIPESPTPTSNSSAHESSGKADTNSSSPSPSTSRSAREWRSIIIAQMDRIDDLQAQINKLSESIHFVTANAYVNGAEYNQYQVKKQQEVKNLQKQLEEQHKKLAELQEAARKDGMGAGVYEP